MSRPFINSLAELAWDTDIKNSDMENITIADPSRLRISFCNKPKTNWPAIVEPLPSFEEEPKEEMVVLDISSVISKQPKPDAKKQLKSDVIISTQFEAQPWALSLAYVLFVLSLALCNLLQYSSRACCVAASPLPVACLALQSATALSPHVGVALLACALLLPCTCALWSLPISAAYIVVLSFAMLAYTRQRGLVSYVCSTGAVLSLGQTLLVADPQWGVSVSVFFLGLLCVASCEKTQVRVWI
jgi:hypothetical protein